MTRVLVAYASKNGSTAEIADAIAQELQRHGLEVDCLEASAVRHLESYGAVVRAGLAVLLAGGSPVGPTPSGVRSQ